jgi:hypothetical protein
MAPTPSISSFFISPSQAHRYRHTFRFRFTNDVNLTLLPTRTQFNSPPRVQQHSTTPSPSPPPPPEEKKSFAVATGELFLGIASRLINSRESTPVAMFENSNPSSTVMYNGKERIGAVMEDEIQPDVIWEQRVKDIEAERSRRVVTTPGFSFSAAGLLFPYHLGVAHFLIQNGYIKVYPPFFNS